MIPEDSEFARDFSPLTWPAAAIRANRLTPTGFAARNKKRREKTLSAFCVNQRVRIVRPSWARLPD